MEKQKFGIRTLLDTIATPVASAMRMRLGPEEVELLAERAIFWPARSVLFVADLHLGKAATFAAAGVPVPCAAADSDLRRLSACILRTGARTLVILGDFLHARHAREPETQRLLARWRGEHPPEALEIVLVRGNHDVSAGDPPGALHIRVVPDPHVAAPFVYAHEPCEAPEGYVLCGHVHPGVGLHGAGGARERAACFVIGTGRAILPAFGTFTGRAGFPTREGDRIVAAGEELVEIGQVVVATESRGRAAPR